MCNCIYLRQSDATPDPINFLLCSAQPCRHPLNYFLLQSILVILTKANFILIPQTLPTTIWTTSLLSKEKFDWLKSIVLQLLSIGNVLWLQLKSIHEFSYPKFGFYNDQTRPDQTRPDHHTDHFILWIYLCRFGQVLDQMTVYLNWKLEMSWALKWHHKI